MIFYEFYQTNLKLTEVQSSHVSTFTNDFDKMDVR